MSFKDRPWSQRFTELGDQAEGEFLKRFPDAHRLGLNRPRWRVHDMPTEAMKTTPDFMLKDRLVEVMGFGRDGLLKLKLFKADALAKVWSQIGPVHLWVWDSHRQQCWDAHIDQWIESCVKHGEIRTFDDNGREYYALHHADFPKGSLC